VVCKKDIEKVRKKNKEKKNDSKRGAEELKK
jgi:hypothetical protein